MIFFRPRHREQSPVVHHSGIFKRKITLFQAVTLIVTSTIGAGIFGLPYAVSKVGIVVGVAYISTLGILIMGLNLMLGRLSAAHHDNLQLVGLAKKYLGRFGEVGITLTMYLMTFGVLVVYIIGEGEALSALLGGNSIFWSCLFFLGATVLIFSGLKALKIVGFFLGLALLIVILSIVLFSVPHLEYSHFSYINMANLLFPFGVILFSFSSVTAIPEAHSLLIDREKDFKKAIFISSLIVITAYLLFVIFVYGVTGQQTTEIATIALGEKIGPMVFFFGNIFAVIAMGMGFLMSGIALRDSLSWDYKIKQWLASMLTVSLPMVIFLLGVRDFISAIDVIGGVFMTSQMLLIILMYWKAKHIGDLDKGKYNLHHSLLLSIPLTIILMFGVIYSIFDLF